MADKHHSAAADASASAHHAAVFNHVASFSDGNASYILLAQQDQHHPKSSPHQHPHPHHGDPSAPHTDPSQPYYPPPSYGSINTTFDLERQATPARVRSIEQTGAAEPAIVRILATIIPLFFPVILIVGVIIVLVGKRQVSRSEPPWRSPWDGRMI